MEPIIQPSGGTGLRETQAVAAALGRYVLTVVPQVNGLARPWRRAAEAIPDPVLRRHALATLDEERLNAEAAAVYSVLAPRRRRRTVVRLCVAFQLLYDYLDTLGEQPADDPLENGLRLHAALTAVFDGSADAERWYSLHTQRDDGGYLRALVASCRQAFSALPAADAVRPVARAAAERCGEAQSHTHAAHLDDALRLTVWAAGQPGGDGYRWWEVAAGGISSVAVHAQFAAAADPRTTTADARRIDAAYFPSACALSSLLDSLVDRDRDHEGFASIACYADRTSAADRLAAIAAVSAQGLRELPRGRGHLAILNGIAGFYLSVDDALTHWSKPVAEAVERELRPLVDPVLTTMRLRRRLTA
jgi:tetraprenyl-beta-curcumene synthase